jgi:hypothetical protein
MYLYERKKVKKESLGREGGKEGSSMYMYKNDVGAMCSHSKKK